MIALPFLQLLGFLIFLIVWAVYMGVVASTGEMTEGVVDLYGVDVTYTYFEVSELRENVSSPQNVYNANTPPNPSTSTLTWRNALSGSSSSSSSGRLNGWFLWGRLRSA